MKMITPPLLKFATVSAVLAIAFRYWLSAVLGDGLFNYVFIPAAVYGIAMFINGWIFGKRDGEHLPIYDVGFRFHVAAYLVHNIISELWFFFKLNSGYETIRIIHLTALCWGLLLLIHFAFYMWARKRSIDGLSKSNLFE